MGMITVVASATGRKQQVPAHWPGHPVLGAGLVLPPSARAAESAPAVTDEPAATDEPAPDSRPRRRVRSAAPVPVSAIITPPPATGETQIGE